MAPDRPPNPNRPEPPTPGQAGPEQTEADLAIAEMLLDAYAHGMFPMAEPGGEIYLYDPDPRGVIPLGDGGLRVSRSLRQRVVSGRFTITSDRAFSEVIRACATPRPAPAGVDGTGQDDSDQGEGCSWIDERIVAMYEALHRLGLAHSVEAWLTPDKPDPNEPEASAKNPDSQPRLVGGLYGVHLRGLFAGESMFSRPDLGGTDASKVCLVHLWNHLRARGFTLLDTQFTTPHLERLGAVEISRETYHDRLEEALTRETHWAPFVPPLA